MMQKGCSSLEARAGGGSLIMGYLSKPAERVMSQSNSYSVSEYINDRQKFDRCGLAERGKKLAAGGGEHSGMISSAHRNNLSMQH
jgi:hypothetical protein